MYMHIYTHPIDYIYVYIYIYINVSLSEVRVDGDAHGVRVGPLEGLGSSQRVFSKGGG